MLKEGWNPVLYFSNSNIFPFEEAQKRFAELMKVARIYELEMIREMYDHESWLLAIQGFEKEREGGERCKRCFAYNLAEANAKAAELGFNHFTTTLTVSRFKDSPMIFAVGERYERFEPIDFKKQGGFERSNVLSKEYGLYRQQYCGCEFSIRS